MNSAGNGMIQSALHRLAVLAVLALPLVAAGRCEAQQEPGRKLVVATKEAAPFAMKAPDGTWKGLSIDLWRRVAEQAKLPNRLVEEPTVPGLPREPPRGATTRRSRP